MAEFQRQPEEGTRTVQPIAIRAHKGEVLELTFTNEPPTGSGCTSCTAPTGPATTQWASTARPGPRRSS